jgi:hypothetical protein
MVVKCPAKHDNYGGYSSTVNFNNAAAYSPQAISKVEANRAIVDKDPTALRLPAENGRR